MKAIIGGIIAVIGGIMLPQFHGFVEHTGLILFAFGLTLCVEGGRK